MPRHDPLPTPPAWLRHRFLRIMRWSAALSAVIAGIAVILVARSSDAPRIHLLIATALGVMASMLLGTGLMTLMFLSARYGHDAAAAETPPIHPIE